MLYYFLVGDYEQGDLELIGKHIQAGDRALELGGGIGITGALLGQISGQLVTVCEPNPALEPMIRRTFAANGQQLRLIQAAAVNELEGDGRVTLNVAPGYWWSSLLSVHGASGLHVQALRLSRLLELSAANVLLVDIEGYEQYLFDNCDLASIDTLIMEIHAPTLGAPNSSTLITDLIRRAFDLVDFAAQSFVFKRSQSKEQAA
jgi:FkbM family methyltransferase